MKKFVLTIILANALLFSVHGLQVSTAFAATKDDPSTSTCAKSDVPGAVAALFPTKFCEAGDLITTVIRVMLGLLALIAVVYIIIGGYKYVTSAGNEEAAGAGRKTLTYAIIGLVIAVMAFTIVSVISRTIGNENPAGAGTASGGTKNNDTKDDPEANLARSINVRTFNKDGEFTVDLDPTLDQLKAFCPNITKSSKISATGTVKVYEVLSTEGDSPTNNFSLTGDTLEVSSDGSSATGALSTPSHASAPITKDSRFMVDVSYTVDSCRTGVIEADFPAAPYLVE